MKIQTRTMLCALALTTGLSISGIAKPKSSMGMSSFSNTDREFLIKDAQGSVYDFSIAELAAGRANSSALHLYGIQLISDHARLNQRLLTLGRSKGVMLPVTLADEDKSKLAGLQNQKGRALDRALLAEFVRVNAEDVKDGRKELSTTKDAATKSVVSEYLQTEQKHLSGAQRLQAALGK